ncbi:MAG: hypothetical protein JST54_22500 [Deltaproteobacteria bacterium]|nr:hypothetical protein [Deltaproteobacteria bacterium]
MPEVRVVASGDRIALPRGRYRFVAAGPMLLDDDFAPVIAAAESDGLVQFTTSDVDDDAVGALLRVNVPWLVLGHAGVEASFGAQGTHGFVAVSAEDVLIDDEAWQAAPEQELDTITQTASGHFAGDGWQLAPHPLCRGDLRDWSWAWGRKTWGPVVLDVQVPRSADEIRKFLDAESPLPYRPVPNEPFLSAGRLEQAGRIYVREGALAFTRSHVEPSRTTMAFDAGLCHALASGALGELSWDVYEQDYGAYLATGEGCASLARYLDPAADEAAQRAHWRSVFTERVVTAPDADTPDAAAVALANALQLSGVKSVAELGHALVRTPLASLPRKLRLELPNAFHNAHGTGGLLDAALRAQPRLSWSMSFRATI